MKIDHTLLRRIGNGLGRFNPASLPPVSPVAGSRRTQMSNTFAVLEALEARELMSTAPPAPVAHSATFATTENKPIQLYASNILVNDRLPSGAKKGSILVAEVISGPSSGTLAVNYDGNFVYTPKAGFVGTVTFTYEDGTMNSAGATSAHIHDSPPNSSIPWLKKHHYISADEYTLSSKTATITIMIEAPKVPTPKKA